MNIKGFLAAVAAVAVLAGFALPTGRGAEASAHAQSQFALLEMGD